MKILMRADTHVNIEVPGNAPEPKAIFTQVREKKKMMMMTTMMMLRK